MSAAADMAAGAEKKAASFIAAGRDCPRFVPGALTAQTATY
jgi:hypothetical protein